MDYYRSNLRLLKKRDPALVKRIEEVSPIPSIIQPEINIDSSICDYEIIAVLGFGLGRHIKELIDKTEDTTFILVVDPDLKAFKYALSSVDLTSILIQDRVVLSIGEEPHFATIIKLERYYQNLKGDWKIKIITHQWFLRRAPAYYKDVEKSLKVAANLALGCLVTSFKISKYAQGNLLKNLPFMVKCPGLDRAFGRFRDIPALIIAPGPSLNKNIGELKNAKGRALIISVDTALRPLLRYGIRPDLVVAADWSKKNYDYFFKGIDTPDVTLVADLSVFPKVLTTFSGPIFVCSCGNRTVNWLGRFVDFRSFTARGGGSVTHVAFSVTELLENNPVIFVGLDLSFPDKKTYGAKGICLKKRLEERKRMKNQEILWVDGVCGEKVMTTRLFYNFLEWFEVAIKLSPNKRYIDATEGGARINGTEILTLKQAISTYCQKPIEIDNILRDVRESYKVPELNGLTNELEDGIEGWNRIKEFGRKGVRVSKELISSLKRDMVKNQLFQELNGLQKQIINEERYFMLNLDEVEDTFMKMEMGLKGIEQDEANTQLKVAEIHKNFFKGILKISNRMIPRLKKTRKELSKIQGGFTNETV
ncbi:MAG: DUF115 domain-containing protein [bacterium]|nr:DUF115 domain-containing protein [bacterium]